MHVIFGRKYYNIYYLYKGMILSEPFDADTLEEALTIAKEELEYFVFDIEAQKALYDAENADQN